MKSLIILGIVVLLSGLLAMPALAKKSTVEDRSARTTTYAKANKAEQKQMRAETLSEAEKIQKKRMHSREQVDARMQERMKTIQADSPGNIGPIGGR